jgi:hypothetical protein
MSVNKIKKVTIKHQFRLIDFRSYDEVHAPEDEAGEEEQEQVEETNSPKPFVKKYKSFSIQMFGINEYGKTCSIVVPD